MLNATLIALIPLLPFAGFVMLGLFGRKYFRNSAGIIATIFLLAATALAFYAAYDYFFEYGKINGVYEKIVLVKYTWLQFSEGVSIDMGIMMDPITAVMLLVITFISLMVHWYSLAYMKGEERFSTYYSFLGLFTFSMLALVISSNIFQIYIFWELVGVSSFLLIGFYYDKPSAVAACKKAFIVTRFADLGFLIGILMLSFYGGTLDFNTLIERLTTPGSPELSAAMGSSLLGIPAITWAMALVFVGAAGKSAMFPLQIWLPDAMEGPTPVSALIHAATMVVAGVFLVARLFPVFAISAPGTLLVIAYVGAISALLAAIIACTQTDIKRVLAFSTISQIGYMMFALGVAQFGGEARLGYTASLFHLLTHAMFKALLFLGAGSVIHFIHSNEIKDMGGLRKLLPVTHITFLVACLAIAGIPPFAGFFSKEEILLAAWQQNRLIYWMALFTSGLTAFYMFRLYFGIFWGTPPSSAAPTGEAHSPHSHGEGGLAMLVPLIILAVGAALGGFIPFGNFVTADGVPMASVFSFGMALGPVAVALAGIFMARWLYQKQNDRPGRMARSLKGFYTAAFHKFYFDELYRFFTRQIIFGLIARPAAWFDKNVVDGLINLTGNTTVLISRKIKGFQSGKVQQYAGYFLAAAIAMAVLFIYWWKLK